MSTRFTITIAANGQKITKKMATRALEHIDSDAYYGIMAENLHDELQFELTQKTLEELIRKLYSKIDTSSKQSFEKVARLMNKYNFSSAVWDGKGELTCYSNDVMFRKNEYRSSDKIAKIWSEIEKELLNTPPRKWKRA